MIIEQSAPRKYDLRRILFLFMCFTVSLCVAYWGQPLISGNESAINTVVTIFSILAGFLIAVISLMVEPFMRGVKTEAEISIIKDVVYRKLLRQCIIFYMYLITLGFAIVMFLIPENFITVQIWLQRGFLFLATAVFVLSFSLPGSLIRLQLERLESTPK
jgi:arginine exporter protein ArgO